MSKTDDLAGQISREHAAVRGALEELGGELERLRAEPGPDHRPGRLGGMLTMFRHHLKRHFELEEREGYLGLDAGLDTTNHRRIEHLLAQHRGLESKLDALLEGVRETEAGHACLPDAFAEGLSGFIDSLRNHERAENELVQGLVLQDMVGGD